MFSDSYREWISIYNDEIKTVWEKERVELRKVTMIYAAFQKELNELKTILSQELSEIKSTLKKRDCLQKCKKFSGLAQSEQFDDIAFNKENTSPEILPLKESVFNKETQNENCFIGAPSTPSFFKDKSPSPKTNNNKTAISPILNKNSFKRKKSTSPSSGLPVPVAYETEKIPWISKSDNRTPKNCDDSNIMECSIIEDTPNLKLSKKPKPSLLALKKPKKSSKFNSSKQTKTLTQMFLEPKKPKKHFDSNMASMGITEMIDLINESSGSETDAELDQSDTTMDSLIPSNSVGQEENDVCLEAAPVIPENLKSFVENYDKIPEKDSRDPKFAHKEVVRGKARKNLKGWSCNECKEYYEALNLPPDELEKKKNECSRHRYRFKPTDETYEGFWDLTFGPSPKTQDSEKSIVFNYKKS